MVWRGYRGGRGGWRFGMVEMRVQGRVRGMEVWYGRYEGTGESEGDGGLGRVALVEVDDLWCGVMLL